MTIVKKTPEQKVLDRARKLEITPDFEKMFGRKPTNLENWERMQSMMTDHKKANPEQQVVEKPAETTAPAENSLKSEENKIVGSEELQQFSNSQSSGPSITNPKEFVQVVCGKCQYSNDVEGFDVENKSQIFCHNCKDELTAKKDPEENNSNLTVSRNGITVVIPYLASAAQGHELLYALRSWAMNFPDCHIIIIGDKPDFISDEVIHMPAVASHKSPQLDVTHKIMQAIASDLVTEDFILTNDDIYLANFIELAEIAELKCSGTLGFTKKKSPQGYQDKLQRAISQLRDAKRPIHDYATHTPFLFNKEKMAKVIARYNCDTIPSLISCLYYNSVFPKLQPKQIKGDKTGDYVAYVYRADPDMNLLRSAFESRKIVNHNKHGYAAVLPLLQEYFPDKCKFEI